MSTGSTTTNHNLREKKKIILDVDTGIDDALAILYALRSPHLEVIGITTCFGNVDVDTATSNTLAMLEVLESDVPVYRGAEAPVASKWSGPVPWIHGDNGLGNAKLPDITRRPEKKDAVTFISESIRQYPGEVTIIPVARLTNLAKAFVQEPELVPLVQEVVLMGGAAFCPGNVTPVAEANIWGDPEAAKLVFQSGAAVTMVGLDVTMKARLYQAEIDALPQDYAHASILKQAISFYIGAYREEGLEGDGWCPVHDPMAVALVEDDSTFATKWYHVDVETDGRLTAGMTVVDARQNPAHEPNVRVCVDVNPHPFLIQLRQRLGIPETAAVQPL